MKTLKKPTLIFRETVGVYEDKFDVLQFQFQYYHVIH